MPRNHVLEIPLFVSIIRVFQFVLAIVILGLSAYGVSKYAYDGFGLTLFTVRLKLSIFHFQGDTLIPQTVSCHDGNNILHPRSGVLHHNVQLLGDPWVGHLPHHFLALFLLRHSR